jgi:hypothetical protein
MFFLYLPDVCIIVDDILVMMRRCAEKQMPGGPRIAFAKPPTRIVRFDTRVFCASCAR